MRSEKYQMENIVKFHKIFTAATSPMRSDKAALGTLPSAAFQYCEPVRTASAFGWYIFPPKDIRLMWDGVDTYYDDEGEWCSFSSIHLDDEFLDYWDMHAPEDLKGCAPPFLTNIFVPGIVQIWSGLLVSSSENWSVMIGQLLNVPASQSFVCFEGIVETDVFKPCPLFVNIKLLTTHREILIPKEKPLFQVRPIRRECYAETTLQHTEFEGLSPKLDNSGSMSEEDWNGYRSTVRKVDPTVENRAPGAYASGTRRRAMQDRQKEKELVGD